MRLAEVQGQDRALGILGAALENRRLAHAYLFAGPDGVGKHTVAWLLAEGLLCDHGPRLESCGTCPSCRKVAHRGHPDVHTVAPEKDSIPIDAIRTLTSRLQMTSFEGRTKVAILPEAHLMNAAAQNALLKTLEEPPGDAVLILCTHAPHLLLQTVRSRCQRVGFGPLPRALVRARLAALAGRAQDDPGVALAVALAEGSLGRAREILDEGRYANRAELLTAVEALTLGAPSEVLALSESIGRERPAATEVLELLQLWYRDRLIERFVDDPAGRSIPDVSPRRSVSVDVALRVLALLHEGRGAILGNVSPQLALERTLFAVVEAHASEGP